MTQLSPYVFISTPAPGPVWLCREYCLEFELIQIKDDIYLFKLSFDSLENLITTCVTMEVHGAKYETKNYHVIDTEIVA